MNLRKARPYSILVTGGLIVLVETPPVSLADTQTAHIPSSVNEGEIPVPEGCTLLYIPDRVKTDKPPTLSVEFPVLVPSTGRVAPNVKKWLGTIPFNPSWQVYAHVKNGRFGETGRYLIPTDKKPWKSAGDAYNEFLEQDASYIQLNGITCVELRNFRPVQSP